MRRSIVTALALLGLAAPCLAQSPSQGPPDFGIDTSGTLRNLSVRDATLGSRVPLAILDTTAHAFVTATTPVEASGAKGDSNGTTGNGTDDTAAIEACVTGGHVCSLRPGATYRVTAAIDIPSGGGLIGDGTATLYADPAGFTNATTDIASRYGDTAVVLRAQGGLADPFTPLDSVTVRGIKIKGGAGDATTDGRTVSAIVIRNAKWIDISDNEIYGFPLGYGVRIASIQGGLISRNSIHDFYENTTAWTGIPQATAIEADNDTPNGGSTNLQIVGNDIRRILVGAAFFAAKGYQTDGINMAGTLAQNSRGHLIAGNHIEDVGEGIDNFSRQTRIVGNDIRHALNFGMKLLHDASNVVVANNTVRDSGAAGIALFPGDTQNTTGVVISDNLIVNVGDDSWGDGTSGHWAGLGTDSGCISLVGKAGIGGIRLVTNNTVSNNICIPGALGKWGTVRKYGSDEPNDWIGNLVFAGTSGKAFTTVGAAGVYSEAGTVFLRDTDTGASGHKVPYLDAANSWSATNTFTAAPVASVAAGGNLGVFNGSNDTASPPNIIFRHTRATPTAADSLVSLLFQGNNSTPALINYAGIQGTMDAVTAAAETASMQFSTYQAGTAAARLTLSAGARFGVGINDPGVGNARAAGGFQTSVTTVALLPTCNAGLEGMMRGVSDANSTTYNATAAGSGANHMPVYCNGTAWVLH